jgi:tetratricopeptide (TPR) repeat protein
LFSDTLYQYAQLLRYRDDYTEAILMGHRQVRLKPDLVVGQRGLFRLYQYFLDHYKEDEAIKWLQAHDSEHARHFIGEAFRRAGKLAAADSVLANCLASNLSVSMVPVHLSLARLYHQRQQPQMTERLFWRAVDGIRNQADAELVFEDVKYIVAAAELQAFRRLSSPKDYLDFFYRLWISRDPMPAADSNLRLIEHYRRLLHAEQNYLFDGFRTWANNPDKLSHLEFPPTFYLNDRFNDKGLIYVRHGEPDERALTVNPDVESWRYGPTASTPEMTFHFTIAEDAIGNNWRLTPFVNHPRFLEDRATWGNVYHRLLREDPLETMALENEMAGQSRDAVATGFISDRHTWNKNIQPLNIPSYTAFFKAPDGKSYFDLYYGLPLPSGDELAAKPEVNVLCEHGLTLHDLDWNQAHRVHDRVTQETIASVGQRQLLIGQYHFAAKPDSYHAAFFVRQPATERVGGWKEDLRVPGFPENQLATSSIVLASSITPAAGDDALTKNGLRVVPNPSKYFARSKPVYVYFEVYHLTPDAQGKTSFEIEYTTLLRKEKKSGAKKLFAIFGDKSKPATTLVTERQADSTTSAEYLALDLGRAGKGEFRLSIKVRDKHSGKESEALIDFALF